MNMRGRIVVTVLTMGLAAAVRADMVPVCGPDVGVPSLVRCCSQANPAQAGLPGLGSVPLIVDFGTRPLANVSDAQPSSEASRETSTGAVLTDGQGSLGLCLYTLLALGLCRSAPFVRKLSWACIPDWYYHGGPFQIGHSHAIGPDCLSSTAAVCFVQPEGTGQDFLPQYYWGTIASRLRQSLFTPNILASRGPPSMS
jgi:hypothetical protein